MYTSAPRSNHFTRCIHGHTHNLSAYLQLLTTLMGRETVAYDIHHRFLSRIIVGHASNSRRRISWYEKKSCTIEWCLGCQRFRAEQLTSNHLPNKPCRSQLFPFPFLFESSRLFDRDRAYKRTRLIARQKVVQSIFYAALKKEKALEVAIWWSAKEIGGPPE